MPTQKLSAEIIHAAIEGFESQKTRIDAQIAELRQMLKGDGTGATAATQLVRPRRKMSAAGRKSIAAAQRARWAKVKAEAGTSQEPKPKRKLSAAGRKAISEAAKKLWAAKRASTRG